MKRSRMMLVVPVLATAVLAVSGAAVGAPAASHARPHDGLWSLTSSNGSTFQGTFKVVKHGKRIRHFAVSAPPGASCGTKTYQVSGAQKIKKAPKGGTDTWFVGQSDSGGGIQGDSVKAKVGKKKYSAELYVKFQSPKAAQADLIVNGCDFFFSVGRQKKA